MAFPSTAAAGRGTAVLAGLLAATWLSMLVSTGASGQTSASRRPPRPSVTLPDGPVRGIILSSCAACHGIDEYGYYAMDRASWDALIERMKVTPSGLVSGAVIADADKQLLLDWLVANFGPDATPFARQYVPRPVTEETRLSDTEARTLVGQACAGCHAPLDAILRTDLDDAAWRDTLTAKIARGVPLLIDDVDPLIEWIGRSTGD